MYFLVNIYVAEEEKIVNQKNSQVRLNTKMSNITCKIFKYFVMRQY